jgi:predicted PurR-regulated permease PerM
MLLGLVLYLSQTTVILLGMSFFIAYVLDPLVDRLEGWRLPRTLAIVLMMVLTLCGLVVLFLVIIPHLQFQTRQLVDRVPVLGQWAYERLVPLLGRLDIATDTDSLREYARQLWEWIQLNLPNLAQPVLGAFQRMFTGLANFVVGILNLLIVPVLSFYLLRDFNQLHDRFYAAMPPHWRPRVADWLGDLDQAVGGVLRGQFTVALVLAGVYAVSLSLVGAPLGAIVGVISGFANMVPYMSLVVGMLPALLLTLIDDPRLWRVLAVVAIYGGGQLLEGTYLSPRIMGRETGLHPVMVMVAIMLGGTWFGLLGLVLAVPVAAILKVATTRWHRAWQQTWPRSAEP